MEKKLTPDLEEFLQLNAAQNIIFNALKFVIPALLGVLFVSLMPDDYHQVPRDLKENELSLCS